MNIKIENFEIHNNFTALTSRSVSAGSSGGKNVIGFSSSAFLESFWRRLNAFAPAVPISGKVNALFPINGLLLFSNKVGLDNVGSFARALDGNPPIVPDRLNALGDWWKLVVAEGEICHVDGGTGGVSPHPEVDRRRFPEEFDGGVPIANCTLGGEMELISQLLQLLLRRLDCFILIGCDRGIPMFVVVDWWLT